MSDTDSKERNRNVVVRRPYIPVKENEEVLEVAYDAETNKAVHIRNAYNGASHNYYVEGPDGAKYKVLAYQGTKMCWHFKFDKKISNKKSREIAEYNKHNLVAHMIRDLGCLRVEPLRLCDDKCLSVDFDGLDRGLYKNIILYPECTIVTDTEAMYDSNMKYTDSKRRPDVLFTMNGEEYAIEVIDTHPLYPEITDDDALKKMQFYQERNVNVIVVRINDLTIEQILAGEFKGQWYRSNYAQMVFDKIYYMCQHSFMKDHGIKVNNIEQASEVCNCWRTKAEGNIDITDCKQCMSSNRGMYAFRDRDRINDDTKTYFFPYRNGHCIHCFKTNHFKLMRTTEYLTLANYIASFRKPFGFRAEYFNEIFGQK